MLDEPGDVLVPGAGAGAGTGAGGLARAITAARQGLKVCVAEKEAVFGGTAAFSGGVLWIPGNPQGPAAADHSPAKAREYLMNEAGACFDAEALDAALAQGPRMHTAKCAARCCGIRAVTSAGTRAWAGCWPAAVSRRTSSPSRRPTRLCAALAGMAAPVPAGNGGDAIRLAESVGGQFDLRYPNAAAWMPVSQVPQADGSFGVFVRLLDRYKPGVIGVIGVMRNARRSCNASDSYHDVGAAMIEACKHARETALWRVCDQATGPSTGWALSSLRPCRSGAILRDGYLLRGQTLTELAANAGIEADGLQRTVAGYNPGAARGVDSPFGRGSNAFNLETAVDRFPALATPHEH